MNGMSWSTYKSPKEERNLIILLGGLIIIIVVLACMIIYKMNSSAPQAETAIDNDDIAKEDISDDGNETQDLSNIDCSHEEVDLHALTGEDNPNVYNATTFLRTNSRYLCIEDWGIALSLPNSINALIYTPVDNSTADYSFHRVYIKAIINGDNSVNWGGNYMPDSYFSALAVLERVEPSKMEYIKSQYGITDSNDIFLTTDNYTYFVQKARGKDYADSYRLLSNRNGSDSFSIPETFYDDILVVGDLVSNFENYHVYDESKT